MNSYERVKLSLEHKEPDRIPFDLGASVLTGMNVKAYANLRKYLGLPQREIDIVDKVQQLARIDQDVLDMLKVDVRCVDPGTPDVNKLATEDRLENGYKCFNDEWGITWRMPTNGGLYFDMIKHPLEDIETIEEINNYPWPDSLDDGRFRGMKEKADKYVYEENKAYILGRNAAGIFELALWTRGFENFYADMILNPEFTEALLEKILDLKMQYWSKALETVGDNVMIISEADDVATQNSLLISPELYKKYVHPVHKKLFSFIKSKSKSKVYIFYHSCGALYDMIPYLIEEGVDIINPVQVSAKGMDTKRLKRDYGKDITFWGGGVDTQYILPHGTVEQVREEVKRRIEDLAPGGGFIFNTVHNVQGDVKPENYMAMWETLQEYGTYK